ncbi:Golgin subfamily A member 7/ERF4 family-domain-containing protein [Piptocephalis cylindrospora]|uniref:Ras modification protein ERF4 n=1 Tax=Piptocephalis cylindrospora TaxID=1907219 RepID=A0A4P9YA57_9FUNG|nr:Golgin subfamily A member 7/ERF4 family-domain-containing protein [Piptocephalis cylindrospora]|eukprot:RKP15351.1 Golgin subfamily A member 7/ERF4 family-domain-containing protein [Piptocephalis cylindrospora]
MPRPGLDSFFPSGTGQTSAPIAPGYQTLEQPTLWSSRPMSMAQQASISNPQQQRTNALLDPGQDPVKILHIPRDWSQGEVIRFSETFPSELEGRLTHEQLLTTISGINDRLREAGEVTMLSIVESIFTFLTLYLTTSLFPSRYDRAIKRARKWVDEENARVYKHVGMVFVDPQSTAFQFSWLLQE